MDLNDFFGHMPNRPDHPDMWKLSAVLLAMDSGMDRDRYTDDELDAAWKQKVAEIINERVLTYSAMQRSFRLMGIETQDQLRDPAVRAQVMAMTSLWMDGFIAGSKFAKERTP